MTNGIKTPFDPTVSADVASDAATTAARPGGAPTTAEIDIAARSILAMRDKTSQIPVLGQEASEISTQCYAWIGKFRKRQCKKDEALSSITRILVDSSFDANAVRSSLRNYQQILDSSDVRSSGIQTTASINPVASDSTVKSPSQSIPEITTSVTNAQCNTGAEANSQSGEALDSSSDDDATNFDATSRKRQKRLRSHSRTSSVSEDSLTSLQHPWSQQSNTNYTILSVEQAKTREWLDKWNKSDRAFKATFKDLCRTVGLPRFPRSQLRNVLSGDFVDLDKVYASVNSLVAESNMRARISDTVSLELEGELTSSKHNGARITDQASYTVASNMLFATMLFVFGEYRRNELNRYFAHIQTMFSSLAHSHHICVVNYDKAVRLLIAQSNDIAFDELHKFLHLERANLHPLGINVSVDLAISRATKDRQPLNRRKVARPTEICRNYNAGRCVKANGECQYRHLCSVCHKSGHAAKDNKCAELSARVQA